MKKTLKLGMVGGGRSSQIGDSHRVAANRDGLFKLVAGAFDHNPQAGIEFAKDLGVEAERAYPDFETMLEREAHHQDCIDVVSILTPNSFHYPMAKAFVRQGVDVICEKPVTINMADALDLYQTVKQAGIVFGVMYGYTGYPMIRQAKEMIQAGDLGQIHLINTQFAHGHAITAVEQQKEGAAWRVDPKISGPSFVLADIGTHAYQLGEFVSGIETHEVCANLSSTVSGRSLEDNAFVWQKFSNGANGSLWASAVAAGNQHGLAFQIYGSKGALHWQQEHPNQLVFKQSARSSIIYERGADDLHNSARTERVGIGHPEGYFESFSNVYNQFAQAIISRRSGQSVEECYPSIEDGIRGVKFIEACLASDAADQSWISTKIDLD